MMDRREALLLVERLKRRTRDPDVLALCRYVEGERQTPAFRRPCDVDDLEFRRPCDPVALDVDVNVNAPVAPKRGRPPTPGAVRGDMAAYMRKWRAARKALRESDRRT